jgi:glycogen operon protein
LTQQIRKAHKAWHGVKLNQPDWSPHSHSLAFTAELGEERLLSHFILNAYWEPLKFELPPVHEGAADVWYRWIDTALDSPQDIVPWNTAPAIAGDLYRAEARSVVVLYARVEARKLSTSFAG